MKPHVSLPAKVFVAVQLSGMHAGRNVIMS
jgi:hypothetical protein